MNYITLERGDMGDKEWDTHILAAIEESFGFAPAWLGAMAISDRLMVGFTTLLRRTVLLTVRIRTEQKFGSAQARIWTPEERKTAPTATLFTAYDDALDEWWQRMEHFMQEQPGPQPEEGT